MYGGVTATAFVVYACTAYPTITWWDSSSYSAAARSLGITGAPGSLLLTLLGWPVANMPIGDSPAHRLNVLAAVLAATAAALVCSNAVRLLTPSRADGRGEVMRGDRSHPSALREEYPVAMGVATGALLYAFGATPWDYAVKFTPYVLTVVVTGAMLAILLAWWDRADRSTACRWLVLLALVFGIDFSVHRTNALLIPGAVVWIAIRRPTTFRDARVWIGAALALVAGLSLQLLLIPMAAFTTSSVNFDAPDSLANLWSYVSLERVGGSFLLQLVPRKAPLLSVQARDLIDTVRANFLDVDGLGLIGVIPGALALVGMRVMWRRDRRLAVAVFGLIAIHAAATVLYFNIPPSYFRSLDRHYLPVLAMVGILVAVGAGEVTGGMASRLRARGAIVAMVPAVAITLVPLATLVTRWPSHDASRRYFTRDYAMNALTALPPNAVYFTVGDNDTYPLLYLQLAEGVRRDVTLINLSVLNLRGYTDRLAARDTTLHISYAQRQRDSVLEAIHRDTPVALASPSGPIEIVVRPMYGDALLESDVALLDIVHTNAWRRPITFASTGGVEATGPFHRLARIDGLHRVLVPQSDPPPDLAMVRANLLTHVELRGYADPTVAVDRDTRSIGVLYYEAWRTLLTAAATHGDSVGCRRDASRLLTMVPPRRIGLADSVAVELRGICEGTR